MSARGNDLQNKVLSYAEKNRLFDNVHSIVVGLSGGADSVVLLHILSSLSEKLGIKLYAFHVHHGIRGETAERDLLFCQKLSDEMAIDFSFARIDVPKVAAMQKRGIEEVAREMRYRSLEDHRSTLGADAIAVAHHADDNLETLIFNIARGASAKGGCGIVPRRGRIIRPLLSLTRQEILDYAEEYGLEFVTDETNLDENYTRNFIRANILPAMKQINPKASIAALHYCDAIRADSDYLDRVADEYVNIDDCRILSALDKAILPRVIQSKYMKASGGKRLSRVHIEAITALIQAASDKSRLDLPCGVVAMIDNRKLIISDNIDISVDVAVPYCKKLTLGENYIPEADVYIYLLKSADEQVENSIKERQNIYKLSIQKSFAFDRISFGSLVARSRLDGDRIRFGGMTRRLKKLLCDSKIDKNARSVMPIISDESGVLFVPGFPIRDGSAPREGDDILTMCILSRVAWKRDASYDNIVSTTNKSFGGIHEGKP